MAIDARTSTQLVDEISSYGAAREQVRIFSEAPGPEQQEYLDLIATRGSAPGTPDGVVEARGRPILYFIERTRLGGDLLPFRDVLDAIRGRLACRGERAYLACVEPGRIHVAPVAFEDVEVNWTPYTSDSIEGRTLVSRLVNGVVDWDHDIDRGDEVFDRLRRLMLHSASRLAETEQLRPDILSLLGRALFFRFLRDRRIVTEESIPQVAPRALTWRDCFDGPVNTAATCHWLDQTFNGDFLPLTGGGGEDYFRSLDVLTGGDVFNHLTGVVLGARSSGGGYQLNFDWGTFDFAHVPVGLLSQVYEDFCWHWEREEAAATSVHYTPRNIALTLLDESFQGLESPELAKVLDPACGAGVFLVLAFRKIYRKAWEAKGRRPDRRTIRRILNSQLAGFDVSENALRLAALSLYLTALELDPSPQPLSQLRFEDLRGRVLFNFRQSDADAQTGPVIGSLGDAVGPEHNRRYDVVLSNPPWTSVSGDLGVRMERATREVLLRAEVEGGADYENPDHDPDLPFLIRSSEWCKRGGRIAMALPARLLLKNKPIPASARKFLFRLIDVTGIISGVNLAKTRVWPGTDQPFILLFAHNEAPGINPRTRLVCPQYDADLNGRGEFWIDGDASRLVDPLEAEEEPWLWKAWLVSSSLDVEIVRKIASQPDSIKVKDYWRERELPEGQGCIISEDNPVQYDATHLRGLPFLQAIDRISVYDISLISSLDDPDDIPTEGRSLIILAEVNGILQIRLFDRGGKQIVSTNEDSLSAGRDKKLKAKMRNLKKVVRPLWPPHSLSLGEKIKLINSVTDIVGHAQSSFVVRPEILDSFGRDTMHMPRRRNIYRSPLVLLMQSPGTHRGRAMAYLSFEDVVYVSSYYGFSSHSHPHSEILSRYLHLLIHSSVFLHFVLIRDVQFGAERNKLQKQSIEDFPMVRLENLTSVQRDAIRSLSDRVIQGDRKVFDEVDEFFAQVHGLTAADLSVIRDTLDVGQAYRKSSGLRACTPPTLAECTRFVDRLRELIAPLLELSPDDLPATLWFPPGAPQAKQTFGAILLGRALNASDEHVYFRHVLPLADDTGASHVLMEQEGGLLVGIRNQYRYWTSTRARLLAADIVRDYLDVITP